MKTRDEAPPPAEEPPRDAAARLTSILLAIAAVALLLLVASPFATAFLLAATLAGALYPLSEKLARRLGGRPRTAAALLTIGVLLLVVVPVVVLAIVVAGDVVQFVRDVQDTVDEGGVPALIGQLPDALQGPAKRLVSLLPGGGAGAQKLAAQQAGRAAGAVWQGVVATGALAFQLAMMGIALYFLLLDGASLVAWTVRNVPLPPTQTRSLLRDFRSVSVSVLISSLATSGVQTVVALVGYLVAGVPRLFLALFVTFLVSFVPAIGAGGVVVAVGAMLALSGRMTAGILLAIWGVTAVGLSDNLVRPLLVRHSVEIHGAVIFFSLLGGLAVFGPVGLLAGPLVVSFFLATVRTRAANLAAA